MHARASYEDSDETTVDELALLVREQGPKILADQTKLVLTAGTLNGLNRCFLQRNPEDTFNRIEPMHGQPNIADYSFQEKVTHGCGTIQGNVDVSTFTNLKALELKRVPLHLFTGLQLLRTRLKTISCSGCVYYLEDFISGCCGDRCAPFSWPELVSANLSRNHMELLGPSLKLLPVLVSLDLSYNLLRETDGLQYLTELEYLNLSYNYLKALPKLGPRATARLKVLLCCHNDLEHVERVAELQSLQQIDLGYNCLADHCTLNPLRSLKHLKTISLEGNPISCHAKHRALTIGHLNPRSIVKECTIDGKALSKKDLQVPTCMLGCLGGNVPMLGSLNDDGASTIINSLHEPLLHAQYEMSDEYQAGNSSVADPDACSVGSDREIGSKHKGTKKRPRKSTLVREVEINDDDIIVAKPEMSGDDVSSSIPEESNGGTDTENDVRVIRVSATDAFSDHIRTKQKMEECRQRYGADWLIYGTMTSMLVPALIKPELDLSFCDEPAVNRADDEDLRVARRSQTSDDIIILDNDESGCQLETSGKDGGVYSTQTSQDDESDEEEDAVLSPFIVEMEKPGIDFSTTILVVIGSRDMKEKDFCTGRTIERLDLRSILSIDELDPKISYDGSNEHVQPRIRLKLSYVRKDRRERIYTLEDTESCKQFKEFLKPLVDANNLEDISGALQCLKCSSQFSKEMAKRVVKMKQNPPESLAVFSTSSEEPKEYPCEVSVCPNCDSEMLFELPNELCKDAGFLTKQGTKESKFGLPTDQSTPVSFSLPAYHDIYSSNPDLGTSCPAFPTDNDDSAMVTSDRQQRQGSAPPQNGSANLVHVEVEVHAPSQQTNGGHLKRSESEITIVSNPSQCSIQVMPNPFEEIATLDAISESSLDAVRSLENHPSQSLAIFTDHTAAMEDKSSVVASKPSKRVESCSSDSLTDSACTAVEKSALDSHLGQSPESFISALSSKDPSLALGESEPDGAREPEGDADFERSSRREDDSDAFQSLESDLSWSCQSTEIRYSYRDFERVDHRLKLFIDMRILNDDEELVAVLRSGVVPYNKNEEWPGLLVVSTSRVHLLKITGTESEQPQNWLQKFVTHQLNSLAHLNIRLGSQAFQLEFGPKTAPSCYTFLLRDADHCNNFVSFLLDKHKTGKLQIDSAFQPEEDSAETLQTIREMLISQGETNAEDGGASRKFNEAAILLYVMGYWLPEGEQGFQPVSIAATSMDLYVFTEDLHWPLPNLMMPTNNILSRPQITTLDKKRIQDITALEQVRNQPLEIMIRFFDEDAKQETKWTLGLETGQSLQMVVQALREPWEKLFGIELQVSVSS